LGDLGSCRQKSSSVADKSLPKKKRLQKAQGIGSTPKAFSRMSRIEVSTISDLNKRVIAELKSSDYFVFINFAREKILSGKKAFRRGSLYTNQELAVAISLDFTDRMMILVNQRGAEKERIFKIMVCNTDEFDTFDGSSDHSKKSFSRGLEQIVLSSFNR
jgi:hypothetical protein